MLAICGGYQMLGQYYINAAGNKIDCTGILPHYTKTLAMTVLLAIFKFITKNLVKHIMVLKITRELPILVKAKSFG